MANPVVVFVDSEKVFALGQMRGLTLPVAWTPEGTMLVAGAIRGEVCGVLWLDDRQAVPNCEHRNKEAGQILTIVAHENSVKHMNPAEDRRLVAWGKPVVVEKFHHDRDEPVFRELVSLFVNGQRVKEFIAARQMAGEIAVLEDVATLCQLAMVSPQSVDGAFHAELDAIVGKLGDERVTPISNASTFEEKLDLAREYVEQLRF